MTVGPGGGLADKPVTLPGLTPNSNYDPGLASLLLGTAGSSGKGPAHDLPGLQSTQVVMVRGFGPHKDQQDFPPAATALPLLKGAKLTRGYIMQDRNDPLVKGTPLGLKFLYNPTEWEQDYSLDTSRYPSNVAPAAGSTVKVPGVPGSSTVSFNLILDRTWDVNNPKAGMAHKYGINVDVAQFQKIVGYSPKTPFVQAVAVRLVFNTRLNYYGFITNFSVLYSQFTTDMRCYRGGISGITMQILPDDPSAGGQFSTLPGQDPQGKSVDPTASTDAGQGRTS